MLTRPLYKPYRLSLLAVKNAENVCVTATFIIYLVSLVISEEPIKHKESTSLVVLFSTEINSCQLEAKCAVPAQQTVQLNVFH